MLLILFALSFAASVARANTEKAVFLGPPEVHIPSAHPTLDDLHIHTLTPGNWTIRTYLEAAFPSIEHPHGKPTWLLLNDLTRDQRYEVRVCWAATQPTAFKLDTYELQTVFETPELVSELSHYSGSRQPRDSTDAGADTASATSSRATAVANREASALLLRIYTAADYYTLNQTLMQVVPPVYVDIILDPFLLNVLPRSLAPTVGYIVFVALACWYLAQWISTSIRQAATEPDPGKKDE
ncbi:hypothetical protein F4780DRAFT_773381 [Xylariomycetidae sp. FL0641]|nr:hypothetical protein F4780DRAFT_773381 [Xylariomycetidae sp. FL0641]